MHHTLFNQMFLLLFIICLNAQNVSCSFISCGSCPNSIDECEKCSDGYMNHVSQCVYFKSLLPNCLYYSNQCDVCVYGYALDNDNQCQKVIIPQCLMIDLKGNCLSCTSGYYYENSTNSCVECGLHCDECLSTEQCQQCSVGYKNEDGSCVYGNVSKCNEYDDYGYCINCDLGYGLNEDSECVECSVEHCVECIKYDECIECESTNIVIDNECVSFKEIKYCITYSETFTECNECEIGYRIVNNTCKSCPHNCNYCDDSGCVGCENSYYINNKECYECPYIDNCLTCNNETTCSTCEPNYHINSGICFPDILHCQIYNENNNTCHQCETGYYLLEDGCYEGIEHCIQQNIPNKCQKCEIGYYLNESFLCDMCNEECLTCEGSSNFCSECKTGVVGPEGKCLMCDDELCSECTLDGSGCVSCKSANADIINGECKICESGCSECNGYGECLKCETTENEPLHVTQKGCYKEDKEDKERDIKKYIILSAIAMCGGTILMEDNNSLVNNPSLNSSSLSNSSQNKSIHSSDVDDESLDDLLEVPFDLNIDRIENDNDNDAVVDNGGDVNDNQWFLPYTFLPERRASIEVTPPRTSSNSELHSIVHQCQQEIQEMRKENEELKRRLEALEQNSYSPQMNFPFSTGRNKEDGYFYWKSPHTQSAIKLPQRASSLNNNNFKIKLPKDADTQHKEQYLSDEQFVNIFGMTQVVFNNLPKHKQLFERLKHREEVENMFFV
ncbi:CXXC-rich protein [Entamoeba marina]